MVFKYLTGGVSCDLNTAEDFGGLFDDVVLVADGGNYDIRTYEGNDLINAGRNAASGQHVVYSGAGNDSFTGGIGVDQFFDGSGNDTGALGAGNDMYFMSTGNDRISGGADDDLISFTYLFQDDTPGTLAFNTTGVRFDLAKTSAQNLGLFGIDTINGFEDVNGSMGSDTLFGTAAANLMQGNAGNDVLHGRAGNDQLIGHDGADILVGGAGADYIQLGDDMGEEIVVLARDIAAYTAITDSGIDASKRDDIWSFDSGAELTADRISLKAIDANAAKLGDQAFIYKGSGSFSSVAGEVRLEISGSDTIVHIDTDADAADEMSILVHNVIDLAKSDFLL